MSQPLILLKRVVKRYKLGPTHVEALAGLDLTIAGGGVTAVVGPSGSGKSTLLHVIGGMDRADDGEVFVGGEALHHLSPSGLTTFRRHRVGFVFQAFNLMPNLTALENVVLPGEFAGTPTSEARDRAVELLRRVGLDGRMRHRPGQLSGGEQQRVAIARALINRPALILADEPTGNLDTRTGGGIVDLLASLAGEQTVIVATHDERINRVADRVIHLSDGQVDD
ncbi:MAG: ABC transporter ATP-binding protein [Candidatus Binatia bacterium]